MKKREFGLDVLRAMAVIFVISVHYFWNNGFYYQTMEGVQMWGAGSFRWLFYCCVPMFLLITGYLRANDRPSLKYYCGLFRVIISWLLVSLINMVFWIGYYDKQLTVLQWIGDILDFKTANYSWYVEMFIGVFLLVPFINLAFHSIETQRGHQLMVASFWAVAFLPSLLNGWNVGGSTWNLVPNYWTSLYPFGYYVIGCYIRKYQPKLNPLLGLVLTAVVCMFKGTITYVTADGGWFGNGVGGGYSDWLVCIISVLVFLTLYRLSDRKLRKGIGRVGAEITRFIAKVSFEAYLISWVFDVPIYAKFEGKIGPGSYLYHYIIVCVPIILLSVITAYPVNWLSGKLSGGMRRLVMQIAKKWEANSGQ